MRRSALKFWIPLAIVHLAVLAWPGLYGSGIETRLRQSVLPLDQALAPWLRARFKTYDRGWLSSRARVEIDAVMDAERRTIAFPLEVFHGPLPVAGVSQGWAPLRPVKGAFHAAIAPATLFGDPKTDGGKAAGKTGGNPDPLDIRGTFELDGSTHLATTFPDFGSADGRISIKAGLLELVLDQELGRLRADIDLGGLSLVTDRGKRALSLGALRAHVATGDRSGETRAELELASLALARPSMRAGFQKIRAGHSLQRGAHDLFLGRGSVTAQTGAVRVPGPGWNWKLQGLNLGDDASVEDGSFTHRSRLRIKQWKTGDQTYGPVDVTATLSRLDAGALSRAAATLNRARRTYDPTDAAAREKWDEQVREALYPLVPSTPRLELTIKIRQGEQMAFADLRVAVDPARVRSAASLKRLGSVVRWVATVKAPHALFERALRKGIDSYATVATHLKIDTDEKKQELYDNLLRGIQENGLVTRDDQHYRGRLESTGSKLLVNGKPMDPWTVIKLVAFLKALQGPGSQGLFRIGP